MYRNEKQSENWKALIKLFETNVVFFLMHASKHKSRVKKVRIHYATWKKYTSGRWYNW